MSYQTYMIESQSKKYYLKLYSIVYQYVVEFKQSEFSVILNL